MSRQAITTDLISTDNHHRIIKTAFLDLYKKGTPDVKARIQYLLHYNKILSKTLPADTVIFEKCIEVSRKKRTEWDLPYALTNDPDTRTKYSRKIGYNKLKQDIIDAFDHANLELPEELYEHNTTVFKAAKLKTEAKKALKRLGN